jgi:hypothetical protein
MSQPLFTALAMRYLMLAFFAAGIRADGNASWGAVRLHCRLRISLPAVVSAPVVLPKLVAFSIPAYCSAMLLFSGG